MPSTCTKLGDRFTSRLKTYTSQLTPLLLPYRYSGISFYKKKCKPQPLICDSRYARWKTTQVNEFSKPRTSFLIDDIRPHSQRRLKPSKWSTLETLKDDEIWKSAISSVVNTETKSCSINENNLVVLTDSPQLNNRSKDDEIKAQMLFRTLQEQVNLLKDINENLYRFFENCKNYKEQQEFTWTPIISHYRAIRLSICNIFELPFLNNPDENPKWFFRQICSEEIRNLKEIQKSVSLLKTHRFWIPLSLLANIGVIAKHLYPCGLQENKDNERYMCPSNDFFDAFIQMASASALQTGKHIRSAILVTKYFAGNTRSTYSLQQLWTLILETLCFPQPQFYHTPDATTADLVEILLLFQVLNERTISLDPLTKSMSKGFILQSVLGSDYKNTCEKFIQNTQHYWSIATPRQLLKAMYATVGLQLNTQITTLFTERLTHLTSYLGVPHALHEICPPGEGTGIRLTNIECRDAFLFLSFPGRRSIAYPNRSKKFIRTLVNLSLLEMPHTLSLQNVILFATAFVSLRFRDNTMRSRIIKGMHFGSLMGLSPTLFLTTLSLFDFFRIDRSQQTNLFIVPYVKRYLKAFTLKQLFMLLKYVPIHINSKTECDNCIVPIIALIGAQYGDICNMNLQMLPSEFQQSMLHIAKEVLQNSLVTLPSMIQTIAPLRRLVKKKCLAKEALMMISALILHVADVRSLEYLHGVNKNSLHDLVTPLHNNWDIQLLTFKELSYLFYNCIQWNWSGYYIALLETALWISFRKREHSILLQSPKQKAILTSQLVIDSIVVLNSIKLLNKNMRIAPYLKLKEPELVRCLSMFLGSHLQFLTLKDARTLLSSLIELKAFFFFKEDKYKRILLSRACGRSAHDKKHYSCRITEMTPNIYFPVNPTYSLLSV